MRFNLRRSSMPAIAADFGASCIRMLQRSVDGSAVSAAVEHACAPAAQFDLESHIANASEAVAKVVADPAWSGKRIVASMPASIVTMTHLKISPGEDLDTAIQTRIQDLGINPMIRSIEITSPWKSTRGGRELLCIAMPRASVLRYVAMLHEHGLEITGVYSPASMMLRAFQHLNRRGSDVDTATMYIDLEPTMVTVAFGHGESLVSARHMSNTVASSGVAMAPPLTARVPTTESSTEAPDTDVLTALNRRQHTAPASMPAIPLGGCESNNSIQDLCEELHMCIRHHQSLFGETPLTRVVFTGAGALEANQCRAIAQSLQLPAQVGDPLARWTASEQAAPSQDWGLQIRPQWTIAAGLASPDDKDNAS
jgi:Tfp pilus assembly PilM family ATPase